MSVYALLEHLGIPWRDLFAEIAQLLFQFIDLVFEVVDVQVLSTDSKLDQRRLMMRQCQRVGTERHNHDHNSSPHTAHLLLLLLLVFGGDAYVIKPSESTQLSTEILCCSLYRRPSDQQ